MFLSNQSKGRIFMSLTERYKNLSAEQRETFNALKDSAGLDIFLSATGIEMNPDEKAQVLEYITSGKLPLSDEELENVSGGACFGSYSCDYCSRRNKSGTYCKCGMLICIQCGYWQYKTERASAKQFTDKVCPRCGTLQVW
jgi:hypothetical protein